MTRKPVHLKRSDWASHDSLWTGVLEGKDIGTGVGQSDQHDPAVCP